MGPIYVCVTEAMDTKAFPREGTMWHCKFPSHPGQEGKAGKKLKVRQPGHVVESQI
jgi:hypothetical protein